MSIARFNRIVFNSSGTWTCPPGITRVLVWGMGGGSGGQVGVTPIFGGSGARPGGIGGGACTLVPVILDVVPNTSYTITIGAGGAGGTAANTSGDHGGDTSFGGLMTWLGAARNNPTDRASNQLSSNPWAAGYVNSDNTSPTRCSLISNAFSTTELCYSAYHGLRGAFGIATALNDRAACGMSGELAGGDGGNQAVASTSIATVGGNAPANSGAGGGGGGGGFNTTAPWNAGANGGDGGSGQLIITYPSQGNLAYQHFTSNSSWVAPAGITRALVLAQGGGGGGSGGRSGSSTATVGGNGTYPILRETNVVANTSYSVTIGTAGSGGAPRSTAANNGGAGGNTTFGSLITFNGGAIQNTTTSALALGGRDLPCGNVVGYYIRNDIINGRVNLRSPYALIENGGTGTSGSTQGSGPGAPGWVGSVGGAAGTPNNSGNGTNGSNGTGIGAGGGGGGSASGTGGTGGNGTPGQMWVIWVE